MVDTSMQVVISLKDQLSAGLDKLKSNVTGLNKSITQNATEIRNVGLALTGFATGAAFALNSTVKASNELNNSLVGLSSVASAFGANADEAKKAAVSLASDGLMSVSDAATSLKNLLASRFSLDEAIDLMNGFKDSAAFGKQSALSFGEAIRGATEGIKNGNSILVDNAGVTKNLSNILVEAGYSAQDLSKATTDAGVRTALYAGILKETATFQGDAIRLTKQLSGAQAQLSTSIFNLKASIGDALAPALAQIIPQINSLVVSIIDWIKENPELAKTLGTVTIALVAITGVVGVFALALGAAGVAATGLGLTLFPFLGIIAGVSAAIFALVGFIILLVKNWDTAKASIIAFATTTSEVIGLWIDTIYSKIKTGFEAILSVVDITVNAIKTAIVTVFDFIKGFLTFWVAMVVGLFVGFFNLFGIDVVAVLTQFSLYIQQVFTQVITFLTAFVAKFSAVWATTWNNIKQTYTLIWGAIKQTTSDFLGGILQIVSGYVEPIKKLFIGIWNGVKDVTVMVFSSIVDIIKEKINFVFEMINKLIKAANKVAQSGAGALGIDVPKIPEIPLLAKGGIVKNPTLAMVGEAGPEAVIPLNKADGMGFGGGVTINILDGNFLGNEEDVAIALGDIIVNRLKLSTSVV